ncbi:MAG: ABC transporter permease [Alphaproteobacteria bacterium]
MTAADTIVFGTGISPRRAAGAAGVVGLGILMMVAIFAPLLAPFGPGTLAAGTPLTGLVPGHPFGTDTLGRDIWSETLYGLGVTMRDAGIGFAVVLAAGTASGFLAAHTFGRVGVLLRLGVDVLTSIPALLAAILISSILGQGLAAFAAGLAAAPMAFARAFDRARAQLATPAAEFARATGVDDIALFRRDFLCEARDTLLPTAARAFAAVAITLATMSFFGFGAVAPARDLGLLIAASQSELTAAWWAALFPALALVLVVLFARMAAGLSGGERP